MLKKRIRMSIGVDIISLHQQIKIKGKKNTNEYQQILSNTSKDHKTEKWVCMVDLLLATFQDWMMLYNVNSNIYASNRKSAYCVCI